MWVVANGFGLSEVQLDVLSCHGATAFCVSLAGSHPVTKPLPCRGTTLSDSKETCVQVAETLDLRRAPT